MEKERNYSTYIDGNAVRILEPDIRREREYETPQKLRRRKRALSMNGAYAVFLAVAVVFCLAMCIYYLSIQAQISETKSNINSLSSDITTLTTQNEALGYQVDSYIDLDYIYTVATEDLGMVQANGSQISLYDRNDSEYVDQVQDIPEE